MSIGHILILLVSILGTPQNTWNGIWYRNHLCDNAQLVISPKSEDSFHFAITAYSGALTGFIEGDAVINDDTAQWLMYEDGKKREIHFRYTDRGISITTKNCEGYYGAEGVIFDGEYTSYLISEEKLADKWFENIINDMEMNQKIKKALGRSFVPFVYRLHLRFTEKSLDTFKATVISGCVTGLCDSAAAIIMITQQKHFYIAWLEDGLIYYYTSDDTYKQKLPITISK